MCSSGGFPKECPLRVEDGDRFPLACPFATDPGVRIPVSLDDESSISVEAIGNWGDGRHIVMDPARNNRILVVATEEVVLYWRSTVRSPDRFTEWVYDEHGGMLRRVSRG